MTGSYILTERQCLNIIVLLRLNMQAKVLFLMSTSYEQNTINIAMVPAFKIKLPCGFKCFVSFMHQHVFFFLLSTE